MHREPRRPQAGHGVPHPGRRRTRKSGGKAEHKESDVLGYYMSHLYSLYPKLKFTSEFPLSIRS